MLAGAVKNYSVGGRREVLGRPRGGQKIALGGLQGCPGGGREAPKVASGGEKAPKSVQEGSWSDLGPKNGKAKDFEVSHLGGLGRPLGRLWAVLVALFLAILSRITFLSIFRRFGDGFWYQKSKKKRIENEANFEVFF